MYQIGVRQVNERLADDERSFEDLQDCISRTLAFLGAVPRAAIETASGAHHLGNHRGVRR